MGPWGLRKMGPWPCRAEWDRVSPGAEVRKILKLQTQKQPGRTLGKVRKASTGETLLSGMEFHEGNSPQGLHLGLTTSLGLC